MIEHVPKPVTLISELRRILKPNGAIVFTIPFEKRLNLVKDYVLSTNLSRRVFSDIPIRTEWHLMEYDLQLLKEQIAGFFEIISERILPYWVFRLGFAALARRSPLS